MAEPPIRERLDWEPTPEEYRRIRRLWVRHSIAEDRRNVDGLIATLAPDCVYEVVPTGQRWEGHDGARRFYAELLGAFPNVHFDLRDIVIGPQGVIEVATLTGTHDGPWAGIAATGRHVTFTVVIHFPWDREARRFAGERVYFDRAALDPALREGSETTPVVAESNPLGSKSRSPLSWNRSATTPRRRFRSP